MNVTRKPLFALTAADLMTHPVLTVPREMSLRGAAHLLSQDQVTGAPVVDGQGRCIGVLSATDYLHFAEKQKPAGAVGVTGPDCACTPWTILDDEGEKEATVEQYMTHDPVLVQPVTNIGELARMMIDAHIHRVVVVDPDDCPCGIVSSTDVLAAVANAYQARGGEGVTVTEVRAEAINPASEKY